MSKVIFLLFLFTSSLAFAHKAPRTDDLMNEKYNSHNAFSEVNQKNIEETPSDTIIDNTNNSDAKTKHFNQLVNLLSIALVAILSLLSLALYRNNTIENKSNKLLQEKNEELETEKFRSEKAIRAKTEFLATISHELRTPLNAINIISEILMEENPKESQIENLISLKISANYLLNLINDVLQINKIEAPNFKIEESEFDINEKIDNIKKSLQEIAKLNNVKLSFNIDPTIPKLLIGDKTKLYQILVNLISNAIKFSENGNVTTNLKLISKTNQEIVINFEVIDDGIGIPLEKQETIFEDFTQGSPDINKKFGGTGLGLTIVKKLLKHLGSDIQLVSEEKKGSTFSFKLSFKTDKNYAELNGDLDFSVFKNKKFLIVEDNNITQVITQKLIEKHGATSTIASTGEEALELVKDNFYDIILMDINLPDFNGDVVALEIRKTNSHTPIIAFTAIHNEEYIKKISEIGMNDHITKPVNTRSFYQKIINLLH